MPTDRSDPSDEGTAVVPRDWLTLDSRDNFGTRRRVVWLAADRDDIPARAAREAAQEHHDIAVAINEGLHFHDMARRDLADRIGVSRSHLDHLLNGNSNLSARHRCAFGIVFDFPASLEISPEAARPHR